MSLATRRATCSSQLLPPLRVQKQRWPSTNRCRHVAVSPWRRRTPMAERAHDLIRRVREPERETTAPIDVKLRSVALVVVASAAGIALLYWAREVFIPIVLSVLISYALEPVVVTLMRVRVPRVAAAALVMLLFTGGLAYTGYALSDDAAAMVAAVPEAAAKLRVALRRNNTNGGTIQQVQQAATELQRAADETTARNPVSAGVQRVQIEEP